jgi:ubiquinone/menaquinone biosynthesis C-methylase UbiE
VWDRVSPWYDRRFARILGGRHAASWGVFRVPESELQLLGRVRGKNVLEVGCGAARWSIALARRGARPVGIDLSGRQLAKARELTVAAHARVPLVRGSVERLPFRTGRFDLVFCDWGAMTFSDPARSVPECARVLRSGGAFVFATASPVRNITLDVRQDRQVRRLVRPYFGTYRIQYGRPEAVEFHPPYGVWVELFRKNGLRIERLVETRPTLGRQSLYLSKGDANWARSWPIEAIWKLVKE